MRSWAFRRLLKVLEWLHPRQVEILVVPRLRQEEGDQKQ